MSDVTNVTFSTSSKQNQPKQSYSRRRKNKRKSRNRNKFIKIGVRAQPPPSVPVAYRTVFRGARMRQMKPRNGMQRMRIAGKDLISPIPSTAITSSFYEGVFIALPSNPAYWLGTRIAGIASVYQQYRPIRFDVHYSPSVPTTTPGQVVYGTLWATGVAEQALQQSLTSSPGGGITTCFTPAWSRVKCNKTTLPQEYYTVAGNPCDQSSNPFMWYAIYTGSNQASIPGYVTVHWVYEFTVGQGSDVRQFDRIDNTTVAVQRALLSRPQLSITSILGIPIGILKSVFVPILRKCAILLLQGVVATLVQAFTNDSVDENVTLPPGTMLEYSYGNTETSSSKSICLNNGLSYEIPDNANVIVLQCGQEVRRTSKPVDGSLLITDIRWQPESSERFYHPRVTSDETENNKRVIVLEHNNAATEITTYYNLTFTIDGDHYSTLEFESSGAKGTFYIYTNGQTFNFETPTSKPIVLTQNFHLDLPF